MESAFNLYEQHLSDEQEEGEARCYVCSCDNLKARTLEFPCRGLSPTFWGCVVNCVWGEVLRNYSFPMFCFIS